MRYNRIFALLLAGAALVASSCQKEDGQKDPEKEPQKGECAYSFKPVTEDFSKTFAAGEKIGLYVPAEELVTASEVGADGKIALKLEKELSESDNVCSFIPADTKVSDGVAAFTIPAAQKSGTVFNTAAVPFVAVPAASDASEMKFLALAAGIRFRITSENPETEKVQSVKLEALSAIAGNFRLSLPVVDAEIPATYAVSGHGEKTVTAEVEGDVVAGTSAAEVYMAVAPGKCGGKVTVVTDKGSHEFELEEVEAVRGAVADIPLAITLPPSPAKSLPLDTQMLYNVCDMDGKILKELTCIVSKDDFDNGKNHAATFTDATIKDYFATVEDPNIFLLYGYVESGKYEYGYTSIAARILDEDDAEHAGYKVVEILSSCISAEPLGWDNYTQTPGTGWYDPADGSVTIENCKGYLGWGYSFDWNRKYVPVTDIVLLTASVSMSEGQVRKISIVYSNGGCTVSSSAPAVATATVSGSDIEISGIAEGTAVVTVKDEKGKTAEISVTVKKPSDGIPTDILYDITFFSDDTHHSKSYTPTCEEREVKGVAICSREEYEANTASSVFYNGTDPWVLKNYFDKYTDDSILVTGGYVDSKKVANYFYLAITMQLTSEVVSDGEFAGCKVVNILHSVPCASDASGLSWYKSNGYVSETGTGYFNPKDGSITIVNVKGKSGGKSGDSDGFNIHRKYTPAE